MFLFCIAAVGQGDISLRGSVSDLNGNGIQIKKPLAGFGIDLYYRNKKAVIPGRTRSDGTFDFEPPLDPQNGELHIVDTQTWRVIEPDLLLHPAWSVADLRQRRDILVADRNAGKDRKAKYRNTAVTYEFKRYNSKLNRLNIPGAVSLAPYRRQLIALKDQQVAYNLNADYLSDVYVFSDFTGYSHWFKEAFTQFQQAAFPPLSNFDILPLTKGLSMERRLAGSLFLMTASSLEQLGLSDQAENEYKLALSADTSYHMLNAYSWFVLSNGIRSRMDSLLYLKEVSHINETHTLSEELTNFYQFYRLFFDKFGFQDSNSQFFPRQIAAQEDTILQQHDPYLGSLLVAADHHLAGVHPLKDHLKKDSVGFLQQQAYLQKASGLYDTFGEKELDIYGVWTTGKSEVFFDLAMLNSEQSNMKDSALRHFEYSFQLKRTAYNEHPLWPWNYLDLKQSYALFATSTIARKEKIHLLKRERKQIRSSTIKRRYKRQLIQLIRKSQKIAKAQNTNNISQD